MRKMTLKFLLLAVASLALSSCGILGSILNLPSQIIRGIVDEETGAPVEYEVATEVSEIAE